MKILSTATRSQENRRPFREEEDQCGRGYLVAIGGNEDKTIRSVSLRSFVALLGKNPSIVIIADASAHPRLRVHQYTQIFKTLGAGRVSGLSLQTPKQANDPGRLQGLEEASGIFFTGGDQQRLMSTLSGTIAERVLRRRHQSGMPVGGTSAGAAVLSDRIILRGKSGTSPRSGMAKFGRGLGFHQGIIIDQHFSQRRRLGRLALAVAEHPGLIGVGIDEDTAAILDSQDRLSVAGSGTVVIVDGDESQTRDTGGPENHSIPLLGVRLAFLTPGYMYDLRKNTAYLHEETDRLARSA